MSLMQFAPFFYASLLVRLFMGTANICLHLERFDPKELPYVSYQNRNNSWGLEYIVILPRVVPLCRYFTPRYRSGVKYLS